MKKKKKDRKRERKKNKRKNAMQLKKIILYIIFGT